ncbi:isoleucine--tRNA ligase [Hoeflea poritis]|uniref:Isoleucine--tRNA ligase n=1 Tax=Hoeflea poritis TaxID=2993659 RepID=A0ABT4VKA2_9HYPH|nr:isoleucine--tRNA ligase [Hoeflea poritis]MDA4845129.1 isoleucine--tRNA ligase [Hoeflea poritis]
MASDTIYPLVNPNPSFPEIEKAVLERWKQSRIFERSVSERPIATPDGRTNEFVFYDGPPFANGLPHYGHLATGFVKDLIPRYQTMRGRHVERRFGWDCHGLPAELEVEKELDLSGREEILAYGMRAFNEKCRESVLRYTEEWEWYVTRAARWASFDNDYKTMDLSFMESVIWAFKTLWDKDLVYQGYRVVPYSWAVQTPLSNFETRLDDSYRDRDDPALTVRFALMDPIDGLKAQIWSWTTTPWTLPSNLALCVNPDISYALMRYDEHLVVLAKDAVPRYERELEAYSLVGEMSGSELSGRTYEPLFPYFAKQENAFRVLLGEFVGAEDGTGIVHIAPGFGEEDLEVAQENDIDLIVPVDAKGAFTSLVPDYEGQNVIHEANPAIIRDLKAMGKVVRHEQYRHTYPHCWRTDEPLIYMAVQSWYIKVSTIADRMVELNQHINWTPAHVKDGVFGNWLANARDWNVSRNRFWGSPIPVWQSDDPAYPRTDVYGSLDEIERDFGIRPTDLHRPEIDALTRPNPDDPTGRSTMRRVPEVLDCWFESGSMPFAQLHYPFENKDRFDRNFPGDFVVEYVAQTRGWFYTMMVMATALFDRAPFRNCICHGVVLDENSQKLSKRLRNYPDPVDVFNTYGADALRWHILASPLMTGGNLSMRRDGKDIAKSMRAAIIRLWSAYSFFSLYANAGAMRGEIVKDADDVLDRYILAKTREFVTDLEACLDNYDLPGAYAVVPGFVDALNNWYIRGKRRAFWEAGPKNRGSFDALFTALTTSARALAPLMPLLAEHIYVSLTDDESVHLAPWPDTEDLPRDQTLVRSMDLAREACAGALSIRENARLRLRLPLAKLVVAHAEADALGQHLSLMQEAVNVKQVELQTEIEKLGVPQVRVDPRLGKRLGARMKDVLAAQKNNLYEISDDGTLRIAGVKVASDEYEIRIAVNEGIAAAPIDGGRGAVALDTVILPELQREGWSRDIIRSVQQARKDAGLDVSDRIHLQLGLADGLVEAFEEHAEQIASETLATEIESVPAASIEPLATEMIDGFQIAIRFEKTAAGP